MVPASVTEERPTEVRPTDVRPPPEPEGPTGPQTGRVDVVGVDRAVLVRRADGARTLAGAGVPPGLYDAEVWFPDEPALPMSLGLRVSEGAHIVLSCDADFYTCKTGNRR
jgi:hypothetical protein